MPPSVKKVISDLYHYCVTLAARGASVSMQVGRNGGEFDLRERRALQVLAACIGDVLGVRSEAYRNLVRASASANPLDLHLAQLSFDALDAQVRAEIWRRVQVAGAHAPVARPTGPGEPPE